MGTTRWCGSRCRTAGSSPNCYYDTDVYDYSAASCGGTQYGAGHHDACFTQAAGSNIYGAKAMFFAVGRNVVDERDLARRTADRRCEAFERHRIGLSGLHLP